MYIRNKYKFCLININDSTTNWTFFYALPVIFLLFFFNYCVYLVLNPHVGCDSILLIYRALFSSHEKLNRFKIIYFLSILFDSFVYFNKKQKNHSKITWTFVKQFSSQIFVWHFVLRLHGFASFFNVHMRFFFLLFLLAVKMFVIEYYYYFLENCWDRSNLVLFS